MNKTRVKYNFVEIEFFVLEIIKRLNIGLWITLSIKREIINDFDVKTVNKHTFDSKKLLIDNIMANYVLNGYKKFSKGSKTVREVSFNNSYKIVKNNLHRHYK